MVFKKKINILSFPFPHVIEDPASKDLPQAFLCMLEWKYNWKVGGGEGGQEMRSRSWASSNILGTAEFSKEKKGKTSKKDANLQAFEQGASLIYGYDKHTVKHNPRCC